MKHFLISCLLLTATCQLLAQPGKTPIVDRLRLVEQDTADFSGSAYTGDVMMGNGGQAYYHDGWGWKNLLQGSGGVSGSLTAGRVVIATGASSLGDDSGLLYSSANDALTVGSARFHTTGHASSIYIGNGAGNFTIAEDANTALGFNALSSVNAIGDNNTAVGASALDDNTAGHHNTAIGSNAMESNTDGDNNVAIGANALQNMDGGERNLAVGYAAGAAITSGSYNISLGYSGGGASTGDNNVSIGFQSTYNSATANDQLAIMNAIFGVSNAGFGTTVSTGNIGLYQKNPTYNLHITAPAANDNILLVEEDGGVDIFAITEASAISQIAVGGSVGSAKHVLTSNSTTSAPAWEPIVDQASASTAGATITLDCNSQVQRSFVGSATFAAAKVVALSNTTNTMFFNFFFEVTNVAAVLTVPSDWGMATVDFDGADWTPPATGKYEMGGSFDDTNNVWYVKISGPFTF